MKPFLHWIYSAAYQIRMCYSVCHSANGGCRRCMWNELVLSFDSFVCFFLQITTGTLHHSPPHHPTCILLPSRVRRAPTFPSISRPVHPTASFWKTLATLTSFAWSSNVRGIWVMLCVCMRVISLYVCLSYPLFHPNSLSSIMWCLIQHSVR